MKVVREKCETKTNVAWKNLRHFNRTNADEIPTLWCGREISDPNSWYQWGWNLINPLNVTTDPQTVMDFLHDNITILIDNNFLPSDYNTLGNKRWEILSFSLIKLAGISVGYSRVDVIISSQFNEMKNRLEGGALRNMDYRAYIEALKCE